jgi:hypothetical protein
LLKVVNRKLPYIKLTTLIPPLINDVLNMISLNRRVANKKPYPCKCGNRLGKCFFRLKINNYRKLAPRSWYKSDIFQNL